MAWGGVGRGELQEVWCKEGGGFGALNLYCLAKITAETWKRGGMKRKRKMVKRKRGTIQKGSKERMNRR
jgi:hypothetical protein